MTHPGKLVTITADITIAGGGLAGVCAAIAAARQGRTVSLIQNRPVLGGNSSSEIRVWTRGSTGGGNLFSEEMGILGELKLANQYKNPEGNPILWDEILLDAVYQEHAISLFLNTLVVDVAHQDGHIQSLTALEINSERRFQFRSPVYVDATGDGFIAASAGLSYVIGKECNGTYGEEHAPEQFDPTTQGCTILMTFIKRDRPVAFVPPSYAYPIEYIEKLLNNGGRMVSEKSNGCDFWWVEFGGQKDTINEIASITLELKRLTLGIYNYIKNSGKFDADTLELNWTGSLPGKRESRRFVTEYVLTETDILQNRTFNDVAFHGGWYLDFHPSEGIYSKADFCTQIPVDLYGIPLRCLFSSQSDNLLVCGRILGASHAAFASTRIMDTCALSGQAAGTAASVLVSDQLKTPDLLDKSVYARIQALLVEGDMLLPGYHQETISENIHVEASSVIDGLPGKECGALSCHRDCFLAIPTELAAVSSLFLDAKQEALLQVSYRYAALPSRNSKQGEWFHGMLELKQGRTSVDLARFSRKEDAYLLLVLHASHGVSIPLVNKDLVGVLCGLRDSATYHHPLLSIRSFVSYGPENLINGHSRPYNRAHIWLSGKEEQPTIRLNLEKSRSITAISLFFDCGLSEEMVSSRVADVDPHHNIQLRSGVSPNLVRDFDVYVRIGDEDVLVRRIRDNYQRHVMVRFECCDTASLLIRFLRTHGSEHTGVYAIRIH
ncbi:MAG: FAD-dependent oxidoreductase [Sphaerochaeta sp.]|nr:FAD-dependent oxidoreductase [Sphaerochaeta sp.]